MRRISKYYCLEKGRGRGKADRYLIIKKFKIELD